LRIRTSQLAVKSDAMMLRRILQNLLANAIRYTRSGGVVMGRRLFDVVNGPDGWNDETSEVAAHANIILTSWIPAIKASTSSRLL